MRPLRFATIGAALAAVTLAAPASATTLFGMVNTGELFASTSSGATWTARSTLTITDAAPLAAGLTATTLYLVRIDGPELLTFQLFDVGGRLIGSRAPESFGAAGGYTVSWNPGNLGGGVYFVRLASASGKTDGTRWAILR